MEFAVFPCGFELCGGFCASQDACVCVDAWAAVFEGDAVGFVSAQGDGGAGVFGSHDDDVAARGEFEFVEPVCDANAHGGGVSSRKPELSGIEQGVVVVGGQFRGLGKTLWWCLDRPAQRDQDGACKKTWRLEHGEAPWNAVNSGCFGTDAVWTLWDQWSSMRPVLSTAPRELS